MRAGKAAKSANRRQTEDEDEDKDEDEGAVGAKSAKTCAEAFKCEYARIAETMSWLM
jgi:hypothetical protein